MSVIVLSRMELSLAPARPEDVLALQRNEDAGESLLNVFNRTQEWILKGGFPVINSKGATRKARAIPSIDDSGQLNTGMWDLAEQFSIN